MSGVPTDLSYERVVRALLKSGFSIKRQGKHVIMSDRDENVVVIPRHARVKKATLRDIIDDADLTVDQFRALL